MKKHTLTLIILAIIIAFGAFWLLGTNKAAAPASSSGKSSTDQSAASSQNDEASTASNPSDCATVEQPTITHAAGKFSPACVTVKPGTMITWVNKDSQAIEVGTDPHPEHTGNREISGNEFVLLVAGGSQATSKLSAEGTHSYHNHTDPDTKGTVVVQ